MPFQVRNTHAASKAFKRAAKARQARNRGRGKGRAAEGTFDYLKLTDIPVRLRIPPQSYDFLSFDKESYEVVEVKDSPILEAASHFCRKKRRSFNCSAGPHRKEPCYGCALERIYWDGINEKEEEIRKMGLKDVKIEKNNSPSNRSIRNCMAVLGVDVYFEVPLTDGKGNPRTNAAGDVIKRYVAEPLARFPKGVTFPHKLGHNMHWSFSQRHLTHLENINERLELVCASCGSEMFARQFACSACMHIEMAFDHSVEKEDLFQLKREEIGCSKCQNPEVVPLLECPGCDSPVEGGLMDFDLRLKAVPTDDKNSDLELVEWSIPDYPEELNALYTNPLDIVKIYAPTPLNVQKDILGDMAEGVDPSAGAFTESYTTEKHSGTPFDD